MNTSSEPRRCPACSAEIPDEAPQGLCPKCLLLGVASAAELTANSEGSAAAGGSRSGASPRGRSGSAANENRPAPPTVEELAAAFPQLEIMELIGRGGMGFVYKARQPKLDRFVALKILPGHLASEPSFHERFEREARVLAKLQHPLIVSVYDFGEAAVGGLSDSVGRMGLMRTMGPAEPTATSESLRFINPIPPLSPIPEAAPPASPFYYLMLEYVDGVNLREAMRAGRFTPDQALAIVPQVCEALQYAHSKGVLHRDIKPENILLDTDGRVKIADFGIAKVLGPEMDASSSLFAPGGASESELAVTRLTATGSVLGTPLYMAPEQLISPNSVDHRADIFSLGVVFYEMLTGELPMGRFAAPSAKALANQSIDHRIDDIVLKALAKEKELRQQSAGEMKTEVETVASQTKEHLAKLRGFAQGGSNPGHPVVRTDERSNRFFPESEPRGNTSGNGGWLALAALMAGTPLAILPFITFLRSSGPPPHLSGAWIAFATLMMVVWTIGGTLLPIWLGWRHLIGQHRDRSRNGIIPAMIAAYFLALCSANLLVAVFAVGWVADNSDQFAWFARYVGTLVCLALDATVLHATWCWATHRSPAWQRQLKTVAKADSRRRPVLTQPLLDATMTIVGVVSIVLLYYWFIPMWGTSVGPPPRLSDSDHGGGIALPAYASRDAARNSHGDARPVQLPRPIPVSAAAEEAKRLGLILVAESSSEVSVFQQPIGLKGGETEVFVEPHFSALVRMTKPDTHLSYTCKRDMYSLSSRATVADYPCDYISCDWTLGTSQPLIQGYILPPGAYDFRADVETTKRLSAADSTVRAQVAWATLQLTTDAARETAATESDWQQATRAAHLRFKLVPKSLSKLNVPDECLVVLTDDSRTVFTREAGRFMRHELTLTDSIRILRESIGVAVTTRLEADVKSLLDKAHRAVKQQNWEELLTCFTDEGRDEWVFEITTGCSLALAMMQDRDGVEVLKAIPAIATLTQLTDELKKLSRQPTTEQGKLLEQRYESYSKLSAADRRQLRIDVMRLSYMDPARVATTTLTFVRQLDEKKLIIDFSAVTDLHIEDDRATGTWGTTDGKLNPIVVRRVESNGKRIWRIDSLIGKSVMDPPFPVMGFPAELMLEPGEPDDPDSRKDAPADATEPENIPDELPARERKRIDFDE